MIFRYSIKSNSQTSFSDSDPFITLTFRVRCEEALALRQRLSFKKKKNPIHPTLGTFEKSSSASNQHFHHSTKLVVRTYNSDLVGRESSRGVGEADG